MLIIINADLEAARRAGLASRISYSFLVDI